MQTNDYSKIPDYLKSLPHWNLYKGDVPISPVTKIAGGQTRKELCASFEETIKLLSRKYDGLGFCFFDAGIVGIDLDTCRYPETGEISKEALRIIRYLNSYTEISQSGYGVHIFINL